MERFPSFLDWWNAGNRDRFDALLFDIDGTLIDGSKQAVPGAAELIAELRNTQKPFRLLTNDGNHSHRQKTDFLNRAGFSFSPDDITSCSDALVKLASEKNLTGKPVFIMGDLGTPGEHYAAAAGMIPVFNMAELEKCSAVIVGEGRYDWYSVFHAVVNFFVRHPDCPLIAPNPDTHWPNLNGGFGIGAGAKAKFLVTQLADMGFSISCVFLGKPYRGIFDMALRTMFPNQKQPSFDRVLMLGDFLKSDILGANRLSIASALLMTGVTSEEILRRAPSEETPDLVFQGY